MLASYVSGGIISETYDLTNRRGYVNSVLKTTFPLTTRDYKAGKGYIGRAMVDGEPMNGELYYLSSKERMRKIDAGTSTISTVINKSGDTGLGTENGPATSAKMYDPTQIIGVGNYIYIADYGNDRVRVLSLATNIITTVVGRTMTNS
eukprot:gene32921-40638_t